MRTNYKFSDPEGTYFTTMTVVYWLDIFTRRDYKDILADSLTYCQAKKGLIVYAYVFMSNHIHLIIGKQSGAPPFQNIIRDFKKFTAMQLIKAIDQNPQESRKVFLLKMLRNAGKQNAQNTVFQFWQNDNHPVLLEGDWFDQKLDYIHQNPVEAGWCCEPEEFWYSSARNYAGLIAPLKITSLYDGKMLG